MVRDKKQRASWGGRGGDQTALDAAKSRNANQLLRAQEPAAVEVLGTSGY